MRSIVVLISLFLLFSQSASQEWKLKDVFENFGSSLFNKIKSGLNFQNTSPRHRVAEFASIASASPAGKARIGEIRHVTVTPDSRTTTDLPRYAFRSKYGYRHRADFRHNGPKPTSAEPSFGAPFAGKTKAGGARHITMKPDSRTTTSETSESRNPLERQYGYWAPFWYKGPATTVSEPSFGAAFAGKTKAGRARHVTAKPESRATTEEYRNVFESKYGHTVVFRHKGPKPTLSVEEIDQFHADLARQKIKRVRNQVWDAVISRVREYPTAPPYDSYEGPIVRPAVYTAEDTMQHFQTETQPEETLQGPQDWLAESRWLLVGAAVSMIVLFFMCCPFHRRNVSKKKNDAAVMLLTDTSDGFPYISPDDYPYEELRDYHQSYEIPRRLQIKVTLILP